MLTLWFALGASTAFAGSVDVAGMRWRTWWPPLAERPEEAPGPRVADRAVWLTPEGDQIAVRAEWTLHSDRPGWFSARLTRGLDLGEATLDGREAPVVFEDGQATLQAWIDRAVVLRIFGVVAADPTRAPVSLELLEAPRGVVEVQTDRVARLEAADGAVARIGGSFWTGASRLALTVEDPAVRAERTLVVASVGMGLTVGDADVRGRSQIRFAVLRGGLTEVAFRAAQVGSDLQVTGAQIADWSRSGDRVSVRLRERSEGVVALDLSWSAALGAGEAQALQVPSIRPEGVFRTDTTLQLARDGELEVVPDLQGVQPIASGALPAWGRGLVTGTPTVAYAAAGEVAGQVGLYRFAPVSGPATFVDVAAYTVATTAEGRSLVRAIYQVRNDRAAWLRVSPPAGMRVVGARVSGETARIGADGDTCLLPLDKSVETVEGMLSFPVEVVFLGQDARWDRRADRTLALPRLDAPVAVARATVHLPPGYSSRLAPGDGDVVASFTEGEGITYGLAVGDPGAAAADALFQDAVDAWMDNDFRAAQSQLDKLKELGADNENVRRLQSNLHVVEGSGAGGGGVALERRIKEQAKARASGERAAQEQVLEDAERAWLAGSYREAEDAYKTALDIGKKLGKLEQTESIEVALDNKRLEERFSAARDRREVAEKDRLLPQTEEEPAIEEDEEERKWDAEQTRVLEQTRFSTDMDVDESLEVSSMEAVQVPETTTATAPARAVMVERNRRAGLRLPKRKARLPPPAAPVIEEPPDGASSGGESTGATLGVVDGARADLDALRYGVLDAGRARCLDGLRAELAGLRTQAANGVAVDPARVAAILQNARAACGDDHAKRPRSGAVHRDNRVHIDMGGDHDGVPDVKATAMSVVVPSLGETIRYQHLLLPAGGEHALKIRARNKRSNP